MRKVLAVASIMAAMFIMYRVVAVLTGYSDYSDMVDRALLGFIMAASVIGLNVEWIIKELEVLFPE